MTIDEAIAHAREVAEKQKKDNDNCKYKSQYGCNGCADYYSKPCIECAEEHEQIAEWLEELKELREISKKNPFLVDMIKHDKIVRNKAIDDFLEKIQWEYLNGCGIKQSEIEFLVAASNQVAEQLKEGRENDKK